MANALGLDRTEYRGGTSTLCPGCGHDSISNQIISAAYDLDLPMWRVIKLSGIGCSSKTPAYFLKGSHGFNSVHGRMPSVATGATLANHDLAAIAVSGDGDTGSIGFGQYKHLIRRNVPVVYIIENNGVYGLTKGQFSATADEGQFLKYYGKNDMPPIDLCLEAVIGGATFVGRSFSGDAKQVQALLKAALKHHGTAVLDMSPGYIPDKVEITVPDYPEGQVIEVELHDGTYIRLKKLDQGHDPRNRSEAMSVLERAGRENLLLTGLIYYEEPRPTLGETLNLTGTPLARLDDSKLRPSAEALDALMKQYM